MSPAVQVAASVKWTEIAQAAAVMIAGAFAIYRWGFDEWRRARSEIPTLDGTLALERVIHGSGGCHVALMSTWRNCGTLPIYVDVERTELIVYDVTALGGGSQATYIETGELQYYALKRPLLRQFTQYMFEPGTASVISLPLGLPADRVWIAHLCIVLDDTKYAGKKFGGTNGTITSYSRRLLFSTSADAHPDAGSDS